LVISGDSHCGPSLEHQLRTYCPNEYLDDFDEFVRALRANQLGDSVPEMKFRGNLTGDPTRTPGGIEALRLTKECAGQQDPYARMKDMDHDGIAAEVIFGGGLNDEVVPWNGGFGAGPVQFDPKLRSAGAHIFNQWLADFISVAPERWIGAMQIPIFDVDAAVKEITWGREHGLTAINMPAPRRDYPPYNDREVYERLWAAVQDLDLTLLTHGGGGEPPLGFETQESEALKLAEIQFLSHRGLWEYIFGGVFERYPRLRLVYTEQGVLWLPGVLREMDSIYDCPQRNFYFKPKNRPSEYWAANCFNCVSFMGPHEIALRDEIGLETLLWGSDYPHPEGAWPRTRLSMRHAFSDVPEAELRQILGDNAARAYGLDMSSLRPIADKIGPTVEELATPLSPEEIPDYPGLAFRSFGSYS
jgi:predicted TIM-barrel fold metal-dependent hydrolase